MRRPAGYAGRIRGNANSEHQNCRRRGDEALISPHVGHAIAPGHCRARGRFGAFTPGTAAANPAAGRPRLAVVDGAGSARETASPARIRTSSQVRASLRRLLQIIYLELPSLGSSPDQASQFPFASSFVIFCTACPFTPEKYPTTISVLSALTKILVTLVPVIWATNVAS